MIIYLTKSKLFTVEPSKRFAKEFNVEESVWHDCWLKYKLYRFTNRELQEYIHFKTGRKPSLVSVDRWITRTEIFSIAKNAFKMDAQTVQSYFFGKYEQYVINELLKHMKSGVTKNSRSIV